MVYRWTLELELVCQERIASVLEESDASVVCWPLEMALRCIPDSDFASHVCLNFARLKFDVFFENLKPSSCYQT